MSLAAGTRLGHYEILAPLGAGGMGEVYMAEDTRLDRRVALKLLPLEFVANEDRLRRFVQEAKATAALNHPNIAHIYEVGEADGTHYIAMEFIDGETLTAKMQRAKCQVSLLLDYLCQMAEGLAKAHAIGIVHRDLKPDNVMISQDGYTKILDFGLAKLIENRSSAIPDEDAATAVMRGQPLSAAGAVLGTVGYMSPEQAQGKAVDQRSDIFSFGCILYEAATGRRPFEGDSALDTLHKIIYATAIPVADINPAAPLDLQRIIRRCLAKVPEKRYQSIRDTFNDLDDLRREINVDSETSNSLLPVDTSTGADSAAQTVTIQRESGSSDVPVTTVQTSSAEYLVGAIKRHRLGVVLILGLLVVALISLFLYSRQQRGLISSLAVMPIVNESGSADVEYPSDGMTEILIGNLSQLPNLNVKARTSVFRYKGKEINPQQIARELNVQGILTGRLVQRGTSLTLYVELIDAATENLLWKADYNRSMSDLVSLQNEIAQDVSQKLRSRLSEADARKLAKKNYTANPEAYRLYLQGRFFWNKRRIGEMGKAIGYFQQAIAADPNYALAYAGFADAVAQPSDIVPPPERAEKARAAALKALSLDNELAEAHTAMAHILTRYDLDFSGAERVLKRSIELDPNWADTYQRLGDLYSFLGRHNEAIEWLQKGLAIEPFNMPLNSSYGGALVSARRYDEAIAHLKKALELDPNFRLAHVALINAYRMKGMYAESVAERIVALKLANEDQWAAELHDGFAKGGWNGFLQAEYRRAASTEHSVDRVSYYNEAVVLAELGEKEKAFAALNKSFEAHENPSLVVLKVEPRLDALRDDPRFDGLLKRIGFPQ